MKIITANPRYKLLLMSFLTEGMVLVFALFLARFFRISLFPLTENLLRDILLGTLGASFPLVLFMFSLSRHSEKIPFMGSIKNVVLTDIKNLFSNANLLDICMISVIAGFAEELLFRGVIQTKLGIIGASVIFGLLHFVTPAYCIIAVIMGFYLGFLFQYSESLLVPIQLHFVYDLGALVYLRYYVRT